MGGGKEGREGVEKKGGSKEGRKGGWKERGGEGRRSNRPLLLQIVEAEVDRFL